MSQFSADDVLRIVNASQSPKEMLAVLRDLVPERSPKEDRMLAHMARSSDPMWYAFHVSDIIRAGRTMTAEERMRAQSKLAAQGLVTTPAGTRLALPEWFIKLPGGQRLAVLVVALLVVLSVELPRDVQDQVWGLITTLGGAIWLIGKITKS